MGTLFIAGTLDLSQFWPKGEADADTAKIVVDVLPGAIRHQPDGGIAKPTGAYDGAFVRLYGKRKALIKNGKLTVRLQGIDAPELHIQPQSMKGTTFKGRKLGSLKGTGLVKQYRQHQAETATARLGSYLATLGNSPLPCQFVTNVVDQEGPADAIDKYGRFVGNICVGQVDINLEILRLGWAIVALYNSMQRAEVNACCQAWATGGNATHGIARYLTNTIGAFDPNLIYRGAKNTPIVPEGSKKFIHPKLFRRQCTWWAYRKHGTFKSGFDTFLKLSQHDVFYELDNYLSDAPYVGVQIPLADMVKHGKKVIYRPDKVIFKDAPSAVYDANGNKLQSW